MTPIILVAAPEFRKAEPIFAASPVGQCVAAPDDEESFAAAVRRLGARHVIVGPARYRGPLYGALKRGGVVARFGQGYDGIDLRQATDVGLLCTNTPNVLHDSVADHTIALLLAGARHVSAFDLEMKRGDWRPRPGIELRGKTLAIFGCGRVGRAVARIASKGLQMHVVGWRRRDAAQDDSLSDVFHHLTDDATEAIRAADFASLHLPATSDTMHFFNQGRLVSFQPNAWIINTARGAIIDEAALYDALAGGRLGGAALDVYEREPYQPVDPARDLRTLENVVLTPHVGSSTPDANRRMAEAALRNIALAEAGDFGAMNLLNPEVIRP